eukprot:GSChrysophyteH2.ASY1.ANO1.1731.1 assembled CDS
MKYDPTTVISWELFRVNPLPYMEVRRPFILGTAEARWKLTVAHLFPRLLADKGLLHHVFTQNIDGLDYQSGVPHQQVVAVHGSIGQVSCEYCGTPQDLPTFRTAVKEQIKDIYGEESGGPAHSTPILCSKCGKAGVKPSTVLYGRNLPQAFWTAQSQLKEPTSVND